MVKRIRTLFMLALLPALAQISPLAAARPSALQVQVQLDRAGFSPGAIDGRLGANTRKALGLFREQGHRVAAGSVPLRTYLVTPEDLAGPFVALPHDLEAKAALPHLGYASPLEELSERFHCTPSLIRSLNPAAAFTAGAAIRVPDVEAMVNPPEIPVTSPGRAAKTMVIVTVMKRLSTLTVRTPDGHLLFSAPVTTGSRHDPLPMGRWKVKGVKFNPTFHYDPDLFWNGDAQDAKTTLPAGPNSPVGLVWIDLDKKHFGLHGTPDPSQIGRTQSHGCVRLTNWDALKLAALVRPGTVVLFRN